MGGGPRTVICVQGLRNPMPIRVPTEARSETVFPKDLAGTVEVHRFDSQVLSGNPWGDPATRDLPVYLPPSGKSEGLPLLMLLTGYTGAGWMHFDRPRYLRSTIVRRFDSLVRTGAAPEAVLVAPDCLTTLGGSQYLEFDRVGTVPRTTSSRRYSRGSKSGTGPVRRRSWAPRVAGTERSCSRSVTRICFRRRAPTRATPTSRYSYLPEFPAVFRALRRAGGPEALLRKALGAPTSKFGPDNPDVQALEMMGYASAYSPIPERPGEFDLPFDLHSGALREEVWSRWLAWDPVRMVQTPTYSAALRKLAYLYVDGGLRDEYGLDIGARIFAATARAQGGKVDHEEFDGVHGDGVPRYDVMIPRLLRALGSLGAHADGAPVL